MLWKHKLLLCIRILLTVAVHTIAVTNWLLIILASHLYCC